MVPEEFTTLTTIEAQVDPVADRISVSVEGRDSALLKSLENIFWTTGRDAALPPGLPFLAYTTIDDLSRRASDAQEHWDSKLRIPKSYRVEKFLAKSWQRQLSEMASGRVGVVLG